MTLPDRQLSWQVCSESSSRLSGAPGRAGARPRAGQLHWDVHRGQELGLPTLRCSWQLGLELLCVCVSPLLPVPDRDVSPAEQGCGSSALDLLPSSPQIAFPTKDLCQGSSNPQEGESWTALSPSQDVPTPPRKLGYRGLAGDPCALEGLPGIFGARSPNSSAAAQNREGSQG